MSTQGLLLDPLEFPRSLEVFGFKFFFCVGAVFFSGEGGRKPPGVKTSSLIWHLSFLGLNRLLSAQLLVVVPGVDGGSKEVVRRRDGVNVTRHVEIEILVGKGPYGRGVLLGFI